MDSSEAIAYLKQMHGEEASQTTEPTSTEDAAATGEQPVVENQAPAPESEATDGSEPPKTEVNETKAEEVPQPKKYKPSKQEQNSYAFQRLKKRHNAAIAEKDARIKELEAKVSKYAPLEQFDFDPNDVKSYIDHCRQLDKEQGELERLKSERDQLVSEQQKRDASERHLSQVEQCFASDEEREHYWNLLRNGGQKFQDWLAEHDDGTVDAYLGDSDIAPLMMSTLMRNPDILGNIVAKKNPTLKMIALQQLENRLNLMRKVGTRTQVTDNQQKSKPKLPIIGSQVANPGSSSESAKRDWNRYLAEHPRV